MFDFFWLLLLILFLIVLLLSVPVFLSLRNWRQHNSRRRLAAANGWQYMPHGWRMLWQGPFQMAGVTPEGSSWTLKPVRRYQQIFYRWETMAAPLPYGILLILPAHPASPKHLLSLAKPGVRPYKFDDPQWQEEFRLLVTHYQLGERYFTTDIATDLLAWPTWPAAGALEEIVWDKGGLIIVARNDTEWDLFERMVRSGTLLVAQRAAVQPYGMPIPFGADSS